MSGHDSENVRKRVLSIFDGSRATLADRICIIGYLDDIESENEKLWELGEQYEMVAADYRSEIVKLRELVRDMGELLDVLTECDLACKHYHDGCIGDYYYVNARRELGVTADD